MEGFYNECKRNNLKVGAYHFLVGTSPPEAQAENFYKRIKDFEWDLIPMLDVETEFEKLCDDGAMKIGWCYDKNSCKWYYFNEEGVMQMGWVKVDSRWYYLDNLGAMQTGWIEDGGRDYCLYSNGEMVHDCDLYGYRFDGNGVSAKLVKLELL